MSMPKPVRFSHRSNGTTGNAPTYGPALMHSISFCTAITDRDDVRYILDTFPGVREDDKKAYGRYRTRDLILTYMNALEAGDSHTTVG